MSNKKRRQKEQSPFSRLLSYGKPFGRFWPGYLLLSIVSVIFGVLNFWMIEPLLKILFNSDSIVPVEQLPTFEFSVDYLNDLIQYYITPIINNNGLLWGLLFVCALVLVASFVSNLSRFLSQKMLVTMKTRVMKNVRSDLFSKITKLQIGYFHNQRKGDILSVVSNDVNEVQNSVAASFHIFFREPLLVIGFLVMLFVMSPRLTLVTLLTLPITVILIGNITRYLRKGATKTQSLMGVIVSQFEEAISGSRIIKAFNGQRYVRDNFDKTNEEHKQISKSIFTRQELASPLSEFLGIAVAACVLFYGGWLQFNGELGMPLERFFVYILFYWRVLEPAKAIANAYANVQRGLVSGKRIFDILDVKPTIVNKKDAIRVDSFKDSISFDNVCFKYEDEPVLKDINLTIPKGKMVAIVGPSGAGKSTMADLIPRFYDVTGGSIKLDGTDIRDYNLKDLISLMGIVTQEAILFNDTVYNNITFGMTNVTEEDVVNAAKIANADDFIRAMEYGYQTNIGDRGAKLSGGQRQRIAIARAVLKNPPILILDEATSALDTESERLVQDALTNLMKNRTSLVIAHRLSTIQFADEIIVLQNGEIVERGSHNELLKNDKLYSHLCKLQTF